MSDLIGQTLGHYQIREQLGQGGMATVYKAFDTRLQREVAIKIIRHDAFPPSQLERILKRFEREAKSQAKLSHPNILGVMDYGEHEGAPYLVLSYLRGGTLKERMGKPMPWRDALRMLIPVAKALQYAHEKKVIHRDVKPANILLTEKGQPMLSDFGIAKILELDDGQTLTGTGTGVGTPEYMAPEQWTDQVTESSDIYSLGVVLYEMVTGRKPYTADTPAAILLKQFSDPLPRPQQFASDLPEDFENVLAKTLAKKPEDRYASMTEVVHAFETLLGGNTPDPRFDSNQATVEQTVQNERRANNRQTSQQGNKDQSRSNPSLILPTAIVGIIIAGVLILGFLGLGGTILYRQGKFANIFTTPTATFTLTPLPTYTTPPTLTPIPTYTELPTYTPVPIIPTQAPTRPSPPTPTPKPQDPSLTLSQNASCHARPNASSTTVLTLSNGSSYHIRGKDPSSGWWYLDIIGASITNCWISNIVEGMRSGDTYFLPIIEQ